MTDIRIPLDDLTSDQLDALYAERDRYQAAWTSARHRAAMYLQSNQKLSASLQRNHAAFLLLAARAEQQPTA
ncbi:hypothetical protein OHA04_37465 [Streptomyces sp. NBC_01590]|uniref:hypothetical protein n=1 Tax=Streptomyces sp. NBC_01590 TaxID=2975887 RepID=UPI00386AADE8